VILISNLIKKLWTKSTTRLKIRNLSMKVDISIWILKLLIINLSIILIIIANIQTRNLAVIRMKLIFKISSLRVKALRRNQAKMNCRKKISKKNRARLLRNLGGLNKNRLLNMHRYLNPLVVVMTRFNKIILLKNRVRIMYIISLKKK
jgi:hypothetical protein